MPAEDLMAHYIFSDIHGCIDELRELYALVAPSGDDTIVIAGDLIDRGPDSPAVVRFFRELSSKQSVVLVSGNHEYKHSRYRRNCINNPKSARDMLKFNGELQRITEALSSDDITFLDSAVLFYTIPDCRTVVLHGGITPNMRSLPNNASGWSKFDAHILYIRRIDPAGNMVRLGAERGDCSFWADTYDGRFGHILFGHEPFIGHDRPVKFKHATGLDLGCVFGGHLACVRFDCEISNYFTVKARTAYASRHGNPEDV